MNVKTNENWVVEVQSLTPDADDKGEWVQLAGGVSAATAIEICDAIRNLIRTGLVCAADDCPVKIQTRISAGHC